MSSQVDHSNNNQKETKGRCQSNIEKAAEKMKSKYKGKLVLYKGGKHESVWWYYGLKHEK